MSGLSVLSDCPHFWMELDAEAFTHGHLHKRNELAYIGGFRPAGVYDEVRMKLGDHRAAYPFSLEEMRQVTLHPLKHHIEAVTVAPEPQQSHHPGMLQLRLYLRLILVARLALPLKSRRYTAPSKSH